MQLRPYYTFVYSREVGKGEAYCLPQPEPGELEYVEMQHGTKRVWVLKIKRSWLERCWRITNVGKDGDEVASGAKEVPEPGGEDQALVV